MDRSWSLSSSQHLDNLAGRAEREREREGEKEREKKSLDVQEKQRETRGRDRKGTEGRGRVEEQGGGLKKVTFLTGQES